MKALATVRLYELEGRSPQTADLLLRIIRAQGAEQGITGMVLGRGRHLLTVLCGDEAALEALGATLAAQAQVRQDAHVYTGLARPGEFERLRTAWDLDAGTYPESFPALVRALSDYAENDARSRVEVAVFFRLYLTLREVEVADAMAAVAT
ncbi:MAG: hypothetical protein V2I63_11745 [Pseudomonadales bacterium]|jgi:hypothetical protein|nr:hypothetical protein [Pseudomonadales bacterium]